MKHTRKIILSAFAALGASFSISAQQPVKQWQDTPTPAEIAVHNQPYIILQNEIENKLCNNDWNIDTKNRFLILKGDPGEDVILRGTTVHYFTPINRGILCEIEMKYLSPIYKANADSVHAQMKIKQTQFGALNEILARAKKNNLKTTAEDDAALDKMKIINDKADLEMARLLDEKQLATIKLQLNADYTDDITDANYDYHFNTGSKLSTVPLGVQMATLFKKDYAKTSKDTLYHAILYIGNWPKSASIKKRDFFHFANYTKEPWTDKQHSSTPVLENMVITIETYNYKKLIKVINSIDWTKLKALVK